MHLDGHASSSQAHLMSKQVRLRRTRWKRTKMKKEDLKMLSPSSSSSSLVLLFDSYLKRRIFRQRSLTEKSQSSATGVPQYSTQFFTRTLVRASFKLAFIIALTSFVAPLTGQELGEGLTLRQQQPADQWPFGVQQIERVRQEAQKVSALVGQNVILNCPVQFADGQEKPFVVNWFKYPNKLPIYIWYAGYPAHVGQGYESRLGRLGQASLNLSQVRESDQGLYECKIYFLDKQEQQQASSSGQAQPVARNPNGTWIFLDVQAPPHFTQSPVPISYVQAGDSLRLSCKAQSTPAPILRWYKNKVPIDADAGPYRLLSAQNSASEPGEQLQQSERQTVQLDLLIDNIQAGLTTGDYVCLASNSEGSIEARSQVLLALPAVITQMPRNQTRLEGERVEFQCQARALPANVTYRWQFNGKPMSQLKWFDNRHTVRQREGTLVLHAAHRDDAGEYKCQATNGLVANRDAAVPQKATFAEASAHLQVEFPARVTHSPTLQHLPLGMSGQIRCHVQAHPPVEFFTWTLNNQQFDPNSDGNVERLANGSLLIKQASKQYEGKWRCTPFNKHGSAGSSSSMEVHVEEPPQFELRPADFYKANLNGALKIPCEARGSPKPTVTWRRVQLLSSPSSVSTTTPATSISSDSQTKRRRETTLQGDEPADEPDETHLFYAQATTSSSDQIEPHLKQYSIQVPNASSNSDQQQQQQSATVLEQQQQQPTVIVSYSKLPQERSEHKNSYLYLHSLKKEDHGRYECVIENEVATLVASTMLYIEETTPHAATDLRVDTKAWSARLSWTPGYDGGFEQSYVVWYRQIEHSKSQNGELVDVNWHSANVQPSDATSFTVQNLSQDSIYEFYVRAKNIIGEGPRSQVIQASTKRAVPGSVTPITGSAPEGGGSEPSDLVEAAASTVPGVTRDPTSAPQNLSLSKVAQGWVLSWQAPERAPEVSARPASGSEIEAGQRQQRQQHLLPALSQLTDDSATVSGGGAGNGLHRLGQRQPLASSSSAAQVAAYSVELKEKNSAQWHSLATAREPSLLLKDLRPGSEYSFRVIALAASGARGAPSPELKYQIHDNRRKPGGTQALSAGVVSGVLFFIACIVIAVCVVNMCNKRRKRRAEKAAYVMMACPVLESHQDAAALNSNSLINNSSGAANAPQGRVPGLDGARFIENLLGKTYRTLIESVSGQQKERATMTTSNHHHVPNEAATGQMEASEIDFGPSVPVDVAQAELLFPPTPNTCSHKQGKVAATTSETTSRRATPLDDYWIRQPSNRKWGTLTLAASKLAERRALAAAIRAVGQQGQQQSLARTLPRSFRSAPLPAANHHLDHRNEQQVCMFAPLRLGGQTSGHHFASVGQRHTLSPPVPPRRSVLPTNLTSQNNNNNNNNNNNSISVTHKRSISHVETSSQPVGFTSLFQQPSGAPQWWCWSAGHCQPDGSGQMQQDFASMSFGPPAELVSQTQLAAVWWPAVQQQQQQQPQPSYGAGQLGKRNSLARSTLPIASNHCWPPPMIQPPSEHSSHQNQHWQQATFQDSDDPLRGQNPCFGSYKRKRRLPHIEAQFTITPTTDQLDLNGHQSNSPRRPPKNEFDALQRGQLFVRELEPRGLPQSGQRTEARIHRVSADLLVPPVDSINTREKVQSFLMNHQHHATNFNNSDSDCSPIQVDQVDELTFQPYYNLPSLKYTISLPLHRSSDGTLLLQTTSHLRPHKRRASLLNRQPSERTGAHVKDELNDTSTLARLERARKQQESKRQRLGSSSSCPASGPVVQLLDPNKLATLESSSKLFGASESSRRSLESALSDPTLANKPTKSVIQRLSMNTIAPDSLEMVDYHKLSCATQQQQQQPPPPPPPPPPPVPPHRRQNPIKASNSNEKPQVTSNGLGRTGSCSPNSPSPASSSSGSSSAQGNNSGGDKSETTTSTNDNHSVDGHYEFDQMSNCSLSAKTEAQRRRADRASIDEANKQAPIYTQVEKRKDVVANRSGPTLDQVVILERTRFYDEGTHRKQVALVRTQISPNAGHLYDTVYEDTNNNFDQTHTR